MAEPTLFDEASLALIASGGAGKDGKVYSIKPVPEYGPEKVTNGDFATDSNWTKGNGATISGGKANIIGDGSTYVSITQNSVFTTGKKYRVSADVEINSGLGLKFQDGATNENIGFATSSGTYVFDFIAGSNTSFVVGRRTGGTAFNSSVDNISVKEISNDGDFTFSRGSNLAATRVGLDGLIEKGRENLLLQSSQFDTSPWTAHGITLTGGQEGYDGSNNAWLAEKSNQSNRVEQGISGNGVTTFSAYLKAGSLNFGILNTGGVSQYYDLKNGVLGSTGGVGSYRIDFGMEAVGNGWYRCYATTNQPYSIVRIYPARANGDNLGTSGNIYIQDSQLEIGLAATDYIESGATTGKAGLLEDEPRFDYSGGATCPSLLLEPSRTQLVTQSEYFDSWAKIGTPTITTNYGISPDGSKNSTRFESVSDRIYTNVGSIAANETFSLYMKGSGNVLIVLGNTNNFNQVLTSEWQRYEFKTTQAGTNDAIQIRGNGTALDMEIWGAQYEQGSYPTSYIPNHSGGTITRAQENCSNTSIPLLSQTSGTYFLDITPIDTFSNNFIDVRALGSMSNRLLLQAGGANLRILVRAQNTTILDSNIGNVLLNETKVKIAVRYTPTNISVFIDGIEKIDNSVTLDFNPELNWIDLEGTSTSNDNALKHHQFLFFPTALSDTELVKLTTI